ncbi:MAG: hypothetical protein KatS3mg110_0374 [Pirellulaceae bacterium]|nr:MAG: hypothetical protein KatS3mg110_0374 [Pirellulaceae bacterium]
MAAAVEPIQLSAGELRRRVQEVEPAALVIEPRILRRVIKQDRRIAGFGIDVPHHRVYTIQRDRLLVIADRPELELAPGDNLPRKVLLLAQPTDGDDWETAAAEDVLRVYWRLLFHGRVHMVLEQARGEGRLTDADVEHRRRVIGPVAFDEIQSVLRRDDQLLPPEDAFETYVEFAATYWELYHFAPEHIPVYFPGVIEWEPVVRLLEQDVPHQQLLEETRLPGAAQSSPGTRARLSNPVVEPAPTVPSDPLAPSPPAFWRLVARAERASRVGNCVKAAILRMAAARIGLPDRAREVQEAARAELRRLVQRLAAALRFPEPLQQQWLEALEPLLGPASLDRWSAEARLLYDLQKVCVESERNLYRLDWVGWLRSFGRAPLRRPLPLLRQVLITKHLRVASRRLSTVRIPTAVREQMERLLEDAFLRAEGLMREALRPQIRQIMDEVGLRPAEPVERVARDKVVEELLDRVVERGFFHMGDLRDALAESDLKLPDIHAFREAITGDELLRANRLMTRQLEGVYHGGPIYLRLPQSLSSLAFGTPVGRLLTNYLVLPFGGAYVALEGLRHLVHFAAHGVSETGPSPVDIDQQLLTSVARDVWVASLAPQAVPFTAPFTAAAVVAESLPVHPPGGPTMDIWFWLSVLLLGTLLLLLIHFPGFRRRFVWAAGQLGHTIKWLLVDVPSAIIGSPWVQRVLQSEAFRVVHSYAIRPACFTVLLLAPFWARGWYLSWNWILHVFWVVNLFLHTPVGRYADERLTDILVRAWLELRVRVLAAVYQWIMDLFHQVVEAVERLLYAVDEWLRFRQGDPRWSLLLKMIVSPVWAVVRYVVQMCVTLLVEPQINPIKHFPVVTVSHKVILPTLPLLAVQLAPILGRGMGYTVATIIVTLLPGVFGFLVWELKGNWRLYAANRPRYVPRTRIGSHGETMVGLLRPGFHSGTIPRTFTRLRRAYRRADQRGDWKRVNRHQATLHHIEEALERFWQREFCALLSLPSGADLPEVTVHHVRLATNRVDVWLVADHGQPLQVTLEECHGWLVAGITAPGWWADRPPPVRQVVAQALTGIYQKLGVDLIREQVEKELGVDRSQYEIASGGIILYREKHLAGDGWVPIRRRMMRIPRAGADTHTTDRSSHATGRGLVPFSSLRIAWQEWAEYWRNGGPDGPAGRWFDEAWPLPNAASSAAVDVQRPPPAHA